MWMKESPKKLDNGKRAEYIRSYKVTVKRVDFLVG